ncbi:MBL fold metallo-hydrolase [Sinosporangium siamense]|uniref:MBL fold metallo-hydrolase n=1 Tax=Sinosporangium siamense TaxID=1367973 RepID=A0A919RNN4_9ACTN|nr:MBL fold metallo-hydrolase [Sinosporangium siamense]GII96492.1 MBL fold metallo-hydrolase [Sinosporangium siamense]
MELPLPDLSAAPPPLVQGEPVEVSEGVYVIPDGRVPLVPNVGIVAGERAGLVIETGIGPRNGAYVLEQARRLLGDLPLYLTITHFHPEHGFGAQAFKGEASIVYNRSQREELRRKGPAYLKMFAGLGPHIAAELKDVEFVDPDLVYDGAAEIDLGGRLVELRTWGAAHTGSDQTVLVDGRVLFGGDLIETRMFPIAPYFPPYDADVDGGHWITLLDRFIELDPVVVVPGHGEIADAGLPAEIRDYLRHVRARTAELKASGASEEQAVATVDPEARSRWGTWDNPEWIGFAVRAFYADAHDQ